MEKTLVILPAYNEEQNINSVVSSITAMGYSVLVIDDYSKDKTAELATAAGATVVKHPTNMGYGVALQTGYKYALAYKYNWLVQMDGDGQHIPDYIPAVLKPVVGEEADLCIGSRFLGVGDYNPPLMRKLGMEFFRRMLKIMTGKSITDPTSGFQAMNNRVIAYLAQDIFPDDYPDADVIYMLLRAGAVIKEVGVAMNYNTQSSMHSRLINNIYYMFKLNLLLLAYSTKTIKKI